MTWRELLCVLLTAATVSTATPASPADREALYRNGLIACRQHRLADALRQLESAHALAPDNVNIALSLAYARKAAKNNSGAVDLFLAVADQADPAAKIPLELAYLYKILGDEPQAEHWFRRGLPLEPDLGARFRLRREIQQLENRWDLSFYTLFRPNETIQPRGRLTGIDQTQSQGGLEAGRRFSAFGGNGRFVVPYARLLWSFDGNHPNPRGKSTQGGVGVRVKPLRTQNFVLGVERLLPVGRESRGDWMLRASWGWDRGIDYRAGVNMWPVAQVYLDAAAIDPAHPDWYLTAETKLGMSAPLTRGWVATPHLMVAATWQDEASAQAENRKKSRFEAGPGISLKAWFNETPQSAWANNAELTLQYRIGLGGNRRLPDGIVLTVSAVF